MANMAQQHQNPDAKIPAATSTSPSEIEQQAQSPNAENPASIRREVIDYLYNMLICSIYRNSDGIWSAREEYESLNGHEFAIRTMPNSTSPQVDVTSIKAWATDELAYCRKGNLDTVRASANSMIVKAELVKELFAVLWMEHEEKVIGEGENNSAKAWKTRRELVRIIGEADRLVEFYKGSIGGNDTD